MSDQDVSIFCAFDPESGFIFIPATESASVFTKSPEPKRVGDLRILRWQFRGGYQQFPIVRALEAATGKKKWEYFVPVFKKSIAFGYGGLLATGGKLVFGGSGGFAFALDSETGHELWRIFLGGDTYAPPISFTVDGRQVVLISAGGALFCLGL